MYEEWLNKKEISEDIISDSLVSKFKSCLSGDFNTKSLLGIHWCVTQPVESLNNLSEDGHIKKGKFLPPISLEQRMWASSKIIFNQKLFLNKKIKRYSEIKKIEKKESESSGELYFVDVEHNYFQDDLLAINEVQTLVYKKTSLKKLNKEKNLPTLDKKLITITPNNIMLFRFSAISFNSHRIHYDKDYASNIENYEDLVVQGPLIASLVMNLIQSIDLDKDLKEFEFKNNLPAYVNNGLNIYTKDNTVMVLNDADQILMSAKYKV